MTLSRSSVAEFGTRLRAVVGFGPADAGDPPTRFTPTVRRTVAGVAALGLVAGFVVACSGGGPPAPQTARVTRASVTTGVSSTGSLSSITEQNLGFLNGGKVTSVAVKVGDRVTTGQILATIDDFVLRQTLEQQQAQLLSQQAVLNRIINGTQVSGARDSLDQSQEIQDATERQVDAQEEADKTAVSRAKKQLSVDKKALDLAEDQRRAAESGCSGSGSGSGSGSSSGLSDEAKEALKKLQSGDSDEAAAAVPQLTSLLGATSGSSSLSSASTCQQLVAQARTAEINAQRQVEASRTTLEQARRQLDVDLAAGQVSIENSKQSVVTAQNTLDSASSERPFNIEQQRALVANGQALVRAAQKDVDDTVLKAPVDGTVSAINGAVGEFLSPSSGVTARAPGSDASIPGTDSTVGTGAGTGGQATPTRPGGSSFLVLNDINQLQVVLPFEESDASGILPNQAVTVGFDAIPDLIRQGRVLSVGPSGTSISGVINYYVTVVLDETDPRLKDGQTARATVVTQQLDNVLSVPNSAVRKQGADTVVTVLGANGEQRTVTFQPGVVGAERTQVLSGLFDGQEVVLPAGR